MNAPVEATAKVINRSERGHTIAPLFSLPPDTVQLYFQTLAQHDTLKYRFPDIEDPQWWDIFEVIQRLGKGMYILLDNDDNPVAEFTLENFVGRSAQIHFSMHPEIKMKERITISRFVQKFLLVDWINQKTNKPFLKSIFGITPLSNRVACIFALKSGFKKMGILPGGCTYMGRTENAMVSYCTNEVCDGW